MGLFRDRPKHVPVWFMRQAGRYHDHYQQLKKEYSFMQLCKDPQLACRVTLGPMEAFDFDAAILFSDLLFPLEYLGMGLRYNPGPQLDWCLEGPEQLQRLAPFEEASTFFAFQGEACRHIKKQLPPEKDLLGFVGAPWTLYTYAIEGGHAGNLVSAKKGLHDGRWVGLCELLMPALLCEMGLQVEGGADAVCLFDTAAGELDLDDYTRNVLPVLRELAHQFKSRYPHTPLIYYSKHTHLDYLQAIQCPDIAVLGIDWRVDLGHALKTLGKDYTIQGNLDPAHLFLPWPILRDKLEALWRRGRDSGVPSGRWIAGLGHGVLPGTPQDTVRRTVEYIHQHFIP